MRSRPVPDRKLSTPTVAYTASVPISVYKELAAQLQTATAMSEALKAQNQQLLRQNHQLQQELAKAIDSILYWRQINNAQKATNYLLPEAQVVNPNVLPSPWEKIPFDNAKALPTLPKPANCVSSSITEQEQGRYRRHSQEKNAEISSWSLAIAIGLIMVTAFGAGYFMMRPLVRSR